MAEEQVGVAGGAEVADVDIFREQTGGRELRAVGFAKIEMDVFRRRLVTGRLHVEPLERIGLFAGAGFIEVVGGIGELRGEFGDEVGGNFVAAGADGRTDRGEEIGRLAAKFELHLANGFLGDAGERAAPTGVNRGNGSFLRINQKNRYAIGGLDGQEQSRVIRGGSVAFAGIGGRPREDANDVRVDLLEWNEFEIGGAERGLEAAAIFEDVFAGVPFHEAEIEDFFGFERADSAGSGAEAVNQPRKLEKRDEFENLQAAGLAKAPRGSDAGNGRSRGRWLTWATTPHGSFSGSHNQTSIIATGQRQKSGSGRETNADAQVSG